MAHGLNPTNEDIVWLGEISRGRKELVPAFNLSRLIAMGLIETKDKIRFLVSEKGQELLASRTR
jgi:hypothetical protein